MLFVPKKKKKKKKRQLGFPTSVINFPVVGLCMSLFLAHVGLHWANSPSFSRNNVGCYSNEHAIMD
jgi:hypothetical protein